jgi:HK97 gp10 family phage protein
MREMSLAQFIGHLGMFETRMRTEERHALERAAKLVEAESKAEIGHYQGEAPPFTAWAELADSTKEDRVKQGFTENDPGLRTGEMRDSISHAVGDKEAVVGSNDEKLVWFELGTEKQPPRSVLGTAAVHKGRQVAEIMGGAVVKALVGDEVANRLLPIP